MEQDMAISGPEGVRLQKVLARAGLGSRRACEEVILAGRVLVDGVPATVLGTRVNPQVQEILVDGQRLDFSPTVVLMLNKPAGVLTTLKDARGRPTVKDLLTGIESRVFPVGRLDRDAEGLLLFTNDGDLAELLAHPRRQVTKVYLVQVEGIPGAGALGRLAGGVVLEDGPASPAQVRVVAPPGDFWAAQERSGASWLELSIHEGRKRQVKRMCTEVGHPVLYLRRIRYGPLELGNLPPGNWRYLTAAELDQLGCEIDQPAPHSVPRRKGQLKPARLSINETGNYG